MANNFDWDDHNRRLVQDGRQALERTSASLARSNQIAIETENIGTEVEFNSTKLNVISFNFFNTIPNR